MLYFNEKNSLFEYTCIDNTLNQLQWCIEENLHICNKSFYVLWLLFYTWMAKCKQKWYGGSLFVFVWKIKLLSVKLFRSQC